MPGYDADLEEQHDRQHELTDDNGIGDADGMAEQMALFMGCNHVE